MKRIGMVELEQIINRCIQGEHKAQMQLYAIFYKRLYNSCFRILRDKCDAEDAMQESFIKAFSRLTQYDSKVPFAAWITRIAINTSIDKFRETQIEFVDGDTDFSYLAEEENAEENWEEILVKATQVKAAISRLPNSAQIIISLYLLEGYDHEEIAEILNISAGTSRIQYMRAKQKLVKLLKETGI